MICELLGAAQSMALPALAELRPDVDGLPDRVRTEAAAGYRLAAVVVTGEAAAVAVAGFRISRNLAWGRFLYVDDLITRADHRGKGHASSLLKWLVEQARHDTCDELHLDSGVGPTRFDAHAAYHSVGLRISSHHFSRAVDYSPR